MAKNAPHQIDADEIAVGDVPDGPVMEVADALVARGRAAVDRVPAVADSAREALADAQDQVNKLSDMGVVGALGFALGVSSGLLLAGAPRVILALSAVPVALTLRSAMTRGVRPARLVN